MTGGGNGVGKVVARDLAARGAHILLNFFDSPDQAEQTKAELEAVGTAVHLFRASVAEPEEVEKMFSEIEQSVGYLDILVNNSASARLIPVSAVDEDAFARALDTNVKGNLWCARAAAPLMARRGGGCIVNVSSIGADLVPANYVVVGTSGAALEALTRYLAVEFAPLNIRVNTASCTFIDDFDGAADVTVASTPLGRLATAEDLAGVIMFLTSDLSRFVTGQTVLADGGLSLGSVMMSPRRQAAPAEREVAPAATGVVPARFLDVEEYAPGRPLQVKRHVVVLETFPLESVRPRLEFIPPNTVVLTDRSELLDPLADRLDGALALSTAQAVTREAVAEAIEAWGRPVRHIRVLADLGASAPPPACLWEEAPALVALHDLTFLVLQVAFESLAEEGTSVLGLFLDAVPEGVLHPLAGLFSGLLKSAARELPKCLVCSVFTTAADLVTGVRQAEDESSAKHFLPQIVYDDDARKTLFLDGDPGQLPPDAPARLDAASVVVAVGGARGITAEVMKAVAEHFRPRLYLIGTTTLDAYPAEAFEGTRAEFIRRERAAHPEKTPGQLNKEFERMMAARDVRANLREMARHSGAERVTYLSADALDREAIGAAIDRVLAAEGKIDLLINAPGINRAASIPQKSLADFRAVRDLKLRAYQNLKLALRDAPPTMWCNFGSYLGLTGQVGETDYVSGNDLLSTCAGYSNRVLGQDEFTLGWGLWSEVGLGAGAIAKSFLENLYTPISTGEGVHHFVREINLSRHEPFAVQVGEREKQGLPVPIAPTTSRRGL